MYAASRYAGVGRKGRAETFISIDVSLLPDDLAGFLPLIFSAPALAPAGSFEQLLAQSREFAADLSVRLRERVYNDVVPRPAILDELLPEMADDPGFLDRPPARAARRYMLLPSLIGLALAIGAWFLAGTFSLILLVLGMLYG